MFWLGLIVSLAYVPGYTGAFIPTQWVVLSCLLPLALWREGRMTPLHWLGATFLAYAFASYFWSVDQYDAVWGLWLLSIVALAFWLGSTQANLRQLYIGLAIGLTVSSIVAVLQFYGIRPVLGGTGIRSSGLLFSPVALGSSCALVLVGLASERLWWLIPGLVPGLALSQSRGAIAVTVLGLVAVFFRRPHILLLIALAFALVATSIPFESDFIRVQIWRVAFNDLTLFGHGPGSFLNVLFLTNKSLVHPEYVHNDLLQLGYEYGGASLLVFAIGAVALSRTDALDWPVLVAFCALGLFSFPLYTPIPAFLGACVAGRLAREWDSCRSRSVLWRPVPIQRGEIG